MNTASKYIKIVEWSEEDRVFVGYCPGVIGPCCHGTDEIEVYRELCEVVEEWLEIAIQDGKPLPPITSGRSYDITLRPLQGQLASAV